MKRETRIRRAQRVRSKISGTNSIPRVSVFRSNKHFYAQAIDDENRKTVSSVSENELKEMSGNKVLKAKSLGQILGGKLKKAKIEKIIFDRGSFKYHGRVKSFAEGLREEGVSF